MPQQLEIEFKNLLTKDEFQKLMSTFELSDQDFHVQTNHYFDTPSFDLKACHSGLRIRQFETYFECTLKEPTEGVGMLETTDLLDDHAAHSILHGGPFHANEVMVRLKALQIPVEKLHLIGSLTTKRTELQYKGGLLVLDHSSYLQTEDYELEYEATSEDLGKEIFMTLLQQHQIPVRHTDKKIARFMKAVKQERGY